MPRSMIAELFTGNEPAKELAKRKKLWKAPKPRYTKGVLAKYIKLVSTASRGAITD